MPSHDTASNCLPVAHGPRQQKLRNTKRPVRYFQKSIMNNNNSSTNNSSTGCLLRTSLVVDTHCHGVAGAASTDVVVVVATTNKWVQRAARRFLLHAVIDTMHTHRQRVKRQLGLLGTRHGRFGGSATAATTAAAAPTATASTTRVPVEVQGQGRVRAGRTVPPHRRCVIGNVGAATGRGAALIRGWATEADARRLVGCGHHSRQEVTAVAPAVAIAARGMGAVAL